MNRALETDLFILILQAGEALTAEFIPLFREHGLTHQQYNVLRILRGAPDHRLPILDIGERMINRLPDMTRLIDRMEKMEFVARHRCTEDRRVVWVRLAEKGLRCLDELDRPVQDLHKRQFANFSASEMKQLADLLNKALRK